MKTDKIIAEQIASEYAPKEDRKIVALMKLNRKAKQGANIFAYTLGICSSLVLGTGMSLSMKVIGPKEPLFFILGIIIGLIGIIGASINYPIYKRLLEKGKQKYSFEILELAKEIANQ